MLKCEICGKLADKHHIVYRSQGGVDFPLNFKYLCPEHHRGKTGPHKNRKVDLEYKLEMQDKLENILCKEFYTLDELVKLLEINKGMLKRLLREYKLYKEGYKSSDVIFRLMGRKKYTKYMLEEYYDFIARL
ncbi:MAG: HNH endonuclease [Clostridium sp.]|uniref:HNH endonuclease n=1 Tax=Clostridium sp. TaxID=1506 RepID=UPI0025C3BAD6|nr:HNH endonuclease [Clostridium sp.]MCH3963082.1 HNH endonuclease [Clostridium sp.]MCI1716455.1 HNH endonuclease [Clostridium sp.]MCI1800795.1 HNH endonuclease [Clostridium sp.]MCI1814550.1 HNH endonuclease [Clostridium sp.]MCI1871460.1 HNH endonuclease [Clostridium sp.]